MRGHRFRLLEVSPGARLLSLAPSAPTPLCRGLSRVLSPVPPLSPLPPPRRGSTRVAAPPAPTDESAFCLPLHPAAIPAAPRPPAPPLREKWGTIGFPEHSLAPPLRGWGRKERGWGEDAELLSVLLGTRLRSSRR